MPNPYEVTGASTGFGRLVTESVLKNGEVAVATLRKPEMLSDLAAKHPADVRVEPSHKIF
jgi:NADP-dependent 3-hydroxy acid dehydrogenase YdfG